MAGQTNLNPFASALGGTKAPQTEVLDRSVDPNLQSEERSYTENLLEGAGILPHQLPEQPELNSEQIDQAEQDSTLKEHRGRMEALEATPLWERAEAETAEKLKQTRAELDLENKQSGLNDQAIDQSLNSNIVDAGEEGIYYNNFFAGIRARIEEGAKRLQSLVEVTTKGSNPNEMFKGKAAKIKGHQQTKRIHGKVLHHESANDASGA